MEDILNQLKETLLSLSNVIPGIIGALVVLLIGWFLAKVMSRLIKRVLKAVRIDSLADSFNRIDMIESADIKIKPSDIISKVVYYVILLIIIAIAADIMAFEIVSNQIENLINYLPNLFSGALILLAGLVVANLIKEVLQTALVSMGVSSGRLISNVIFYFLFIAIIITALSQAEIETDFITSNLTIIIGGVIGAFAIGYGFASKNIMANLLGSLYSRQKFKLGDVIQIKGIKGTVVSMDNISITLQTLDRRVIIPLNNITTEEVEIFGAWDDDKQLIE